MKTPESNSSPETNSEEREYAGSLELKELANMFHEQRVDQETVLRVIEDSLLEPIPDESDEAAVEEYNAKMSMLKDMALEYVGRSDVLKRLWEDIESRIIKPH